MRLDPHEPAVAPSPAAVHEPGPAGVLPWVAEMQEVAIHRDREAFLRLFDHFAPRLQHYLRQTGTPPERAEELVQDTMLQLWHKAAAFDPGRASVSTWLFRMARNIAIDAHRRDARWSELQVIVDDYDSLSVAAPPPPDDEDAVRQRQLLSAIEQLPAHQATVLRLSYFETQSHSQIAQRLSLPLGTVKTYIRQAYDRLRVRLTAPTP